MDRIPERKILTLRRWGERFTTKCSNDTKRGSREKGRNRAGKHQIIRPTPFSLLFCPDHLFKKSLAS